MKKSLIPVAAFLIFYAQLSAYATEAPGVYAQEPFSSPSGAEVVFAANYDGQINLWIASADGTSLRKLTNDVNVNESPAWSPDGTKVAFVSRSDSASDIWLIGSDGKNLTRLTANASNNYQPTWSPNGTQIAFVSDRIGATNDIWIMNVDGTGQRRVTALSGQENHPSFSPNGTEIVFSHTVDQAALKIVKVDGTGLRTLTSGGSRDWNPDWSKYGILFSTDRNSPSISKIWLVQADGTGLRQMGDIATTDPRWTPNGRILFSDAPANSKAISSIAIWNPTTGAKQSVVNVQGYLTPIDIRPGKTPNKINPRSGGKVAVAILSRVGFDPTTSVKLSTLTFGRTGNEKSLHSCSKKVQDVNSDGKPDLVCRFQIRATDIQTGNRLAILRFLDNAGVPYEGRDEITTVTEDDPDDFNVDWNP